MGASANLITFALWDGFAYSAPFGFSVTLNLIGLIKRMVVQMTRKRFGLALIIILSIGVAGWAAGGGLHPARAGSLTEEDLLARAREFSRLRNVDPSHGTEDTGYISHLALPPDV